MFPQTKYLSFILLIIAVASPSNVYLSAVNANPISSNDCMRNPFATGCRGISAKRSIAWSSLPNNNSPSDMMKQQAEEQRQSGSKSIGMLDEHQWPNVGRDGCQSRQSARSSQLEAIELLLTAANRLMECLPLGTAERYKRWPVGRGDE